MKRANLIGLVVLMVAMMGAVGPCGELERQGPHYYSPGAFGSVVHDEDGNPQCGDSLFLVDAAGIEVTCGRGGDYISVYRRDTLIQDHAYRASCYALEPVGELPNSANYQAWRASCPTTTVDFGETAPNGLLQWGYECPGWSVIHDVPGVKLECDYETGTISVRAATNGLRDAFHDDVCTWYEAGGQSSNTAYITHCL